MIDNTKIRPKNSEVTRLWGENQLEKDLLGWEPKISFDEGLKRTIEYFERKLNKLRVDEYHT